ncbi:hypothetical protein RND71_029993 [Anisodus tanguticus]|uniref:Uncharacterized protein n=1 Tax=Anisodus tanguticus TaxID=243964 RepID=A0AAE1V7R7_9SOLA|nr:hypothetical protein RND71_029993 [Anisodus tanguticus]
MAMPARRYAFGRADEATHPDSMRATLSELLSTFIFVFASEGSVLALDKLYPDAALGASRLIAIALAHALSFFAAVTSSLNVSGGHVNPAITFGSLVGGRISVVRAVYYWLAQLVGAVVASLLLRLATDGLRPRGFAVAAGVGNLNALVMEIVMTFGLMYTVYATAIDPRRGSLGTIAPLAIAFIFNPVTTDHILLRPQLSQSSPPFILLFHSLGYANGACTYQHQPNKPSRSSEAALFCSSSDK